MGRYLILIIGLIVGQISFHNTQAEPIFHERHYPEGSGPFPAIIALHTSGGFKTIKNVIQRYIDDGFAVYAPNFFRRYGLNSTKSFETYFNYRKCIEKELPEIIKLMHEDKKIQNQNIFAVGFSNGGFWAGYLAGTAKVNAGVSYYGVWKANYGLEFTNPYPMKYFSESSSPILALHGDRDKLQRIEWVEQAWDQIRDNGAKIITYIYPEAGHAWDRKHITKFRYDERADRDAHRRTIEFFKTNMK